jgi:hypothetical protein
MVDPHRTDTSRAGDAVSARDRDAKVEQLLLDGLDCYFASRYEQAINVWSRALFFDRGHARARAYIERARRALAEQQRESEELVHQGVAAFSRGEHGEARRLLEGAVERGDATDEAQAVLGRLERIELAPPQAAVDRVPAPARQEVPVQLFEDYRPSRSRGWLVVMAAGFLAGGLYVAIESEGAIRVLFSGTGAAPAGLPPPAITFVPQLPLRAETALTRARMLAAHGRLHDAMAALDLVRPTDAQKGEADRLRADLQRRLISLTLPTEAVPAETPGAGAVVP